MFISVLFFIFIRVENTALQLVVRILLIPVIAGVSYEIIRWAGRSDNAFSNALSKPGLWMQRLTTKEPDMDMIEVAIKAVEAVFDWKVFLKEYHADAEDPEADIEAAEAELALSSNLIMSQRRKSRSISPEEVLTERPAETGPEAGHEELYVEYETEESFSAAGAVSDRAENVKAESAPEEPVKTAASDSETETAAEEADGLPEGFEMLDDEDAAESAASLDDGALENISAAQVVPDSEDIEDTEDTEGFEFVEDLDADDTCADDVPIFKQRRTDKH